MRAAFASTIARSPDTIGARFARSRSSGSWATLTSPLAVSGLAITALWLITLLVTPLLPLPNPLAPSAQLLQAPSLAHLFGTDELGRDVLSRVIWGARQSLPSAFVLVAIAVALGSFLGSVGGYLGGIVESVVMRVTDLFLGFPTIILAMVVTAALGAGLRNAVIALAVVFWPKYARVSRALVLEMVQSDYVGVSRLLGASTTRVLSVELLPNIAGPILVLGALDIGNAVLTLAGLSFLGLGSQPPTPDWGYMVSEGTQYFQQWWIGLFPGLAILSVVLASNFLGDATRDAMDPTIRRNAPELTK